MTVTSSLVDHPRQWGAHYTPAPIVRFMLGSCLTGPLASRVGDEHDPVSILDPACGDGAFVVAAMEELRQRSDQLSPIDLIDRHLYGVDIDPCAVSQLRRRLEQHVAGEGDFEPRLSEALDARFLRADALSGPDFAGSGPARKDLGTEGVIWQDAFPRIAERGGFDLVIGNPPYVREKNAKPLFDKLADTELGRCYRQPRMDLWHYFFHRGLDLLRPGGVLCFIVNSYWTSAISARPLIERLVAETTVQQLVLLGETPLFKGVTGRHMILQVQKHTSADECRIFDLTRCTDALGALEQLTGSTEAADTPPIGVQEWRRPQASLFDRGRLQISPRPNVTSSDNVLRVADAFTVRQGIAENPPFVTRKMAAELPIPLDVGSGVFVLTSAEVADLNLTDDERALLCPYFVTRSIGRYSLPVEPTHWILYLTRQTAPDLFSLPNIARHLDCVRPILERRREVQRDLIRWWHLHWPREEWLFRQPRILAVQMGRRPQFVYAETPTYVGFSVNVVQSTDTSAMSLPALTAMLNSQWAEDWFNGNAKRRGIALDISGTVLRDFPLPGLSEQTSDRLTDLCHRRQSAPEQEHASIENEIDALLGHLK